MPATSFVYEFFLYNSIYQYDWQGSLEDGQLAPWPIEGMSESTQQARLEKFIRNRCRGNPSLLRRALDPIAELDDLQGTWTQVTPDVRITLDQGRSFFKKLSTLADHVRTARSGEELQPTRAVFDLISGCRYFVYLIRNNIFHGSKSIGEIYEVSQRRRLEVYDLFLKCLVSLFFLAVDRTPVAADYVQLPICLALGQGQSVNLGQNQVIDFVVNGLMKPEDSRLIPSFSRIAANPVLPPSERAALFYPSAGRDLITPVVLGLPYCTHFYFYDISGPPRQHHHIQTSLRHAIGTQMEAEYIDGEHLLHFQVAGHHRVIHCVQRDNLDFLKRDVELLFYFHRGDSWGEGGSGQKWDTQHLNALARKIPPDSTCHIVTDGEPGGVHKGLLQVLHHMQPPITEHNRAYYYGKLSGEEFRDWVTTEQEHPPYEGKARRSRSAPHLHG